MEAEDNPTVKAPITLQSVNSCPAVPCCKTQLSEAALAQWKKEFLDMEGSGGPIQRQDSEQ